MDITSPSTPTPFHPQVYWGRRLKQAMKKQKLTQELYAEQLHVDARTIRRWWTGEGLNADDLERIFSPLHIKVSDLLHDTAHQFELFQ